VIPIASQAIASRANFVPAACLSPRPAEPPGRQGPPAAAELPQLRRARPRRNTHHFGTDPQL